MSRRHATLALAGIAVAAFLVRALPLVGRGGATGYPIDYDEGVYFSASALLTQGAVPYRDFVFVHPPGVLYLLAPVTAMTHLLDPATVFAVLRFIIAAVGGVNVFLVGLVAGRWAGPVAALFAAGTYALFPEVAVVERGPFLEPWLNLTCLLLALHWLREPSAFSRRSALGAGLLLGAAFSVKLLGGIWAMAAFAALPRERRWETALWLVVGAVTLSVVLIGAVAAPSPDQFLTDAVRFHSARPPDGDIARLGRLGPMFAGPHVLGSLLVGAALLLNAVEPMKRARRELRFFATVFIVTVLSFISTRSYWSQYNSYLAPSVSILAGVGFAGLVELVVKRKPAGRWAALAAALLLLAPTALRVWKDSRARAPDQTATGLELRSLPADACVFSFEPGWGVVGGRLPNVSGTRPAMTVDPYASMLMDGMAGGSFGSAGEAFEAASSQTRMRALLEQCSVVVLGWRGAWQLSAESEEWLHRNYRKRFPPEGVAGIDVWEKHP